MSVSLGISIQTLLTGIRKPPLLPDSLLNVCFSCKILSDILFHYLLNIVREGQNPQFRETIWFEYDLRQMKDKCN